MRPPPPALGTTTAPYVARTVELGGRDVMVLGKVKAPANLRAFMASGSAVAVAAVTEYAMKGRPADLGPRVVRLI